MIKEPTRLLRRSAGQGRFVGDRDVMPHKEGQGTAPVKEFQERSGELKPGISFGGESALAFREEPPGHRLCRTIPQRPTSQASAARNANRVGTLPESLHS